MKKGWIVFGVFVLVILMSVGYFVGNYNKIIILQESTVEKWAQVENVYQRRMDLIPNLVETVKGYASHEKETLQAVVQARAAATQTKVDASNLNNMAEFMKAQEGLGQALSRLMVVVERYPDLKANQNFLALQSQLEGTENRITVERRRFNTAVKSYNMFIKMFPKNMIANMFGFEKVEYFEADKGAKQAPSVKF